MSRLLYSELAGLIQARANYLASNPPNPCADKHEETIESLVRDFMPSGSGFDNGTRLDLDASHAEKLVFETAYHHMDEYGGYDGWTDHTITVTPSLRHGFNLRISGRNRNDIKELIHQSFDSALNSDCEFALFAYVYKIEVKANWDKDGCKIESWTGSIEGSTRGRLDAYYPTREQAETAVLEYLKANRDSVARHPESGIGGAR